MPDTAKADMPPSKSVTRLAALRRRAKLTQFDLAHKAGVSLTTVVKAERGGTIERGMWALLALALGVHPDKIQP
jgi:DNA-binding XRE family transcriptional regulator